MIIQIISTYSDGRPEDALYWIVKHCVNGQINDVQGVEKKKADIHTYRMVVATTR